MVPVLDREGDVLVDNVIDGVSAYRYQVTTRVHSPASVGAICSPSMALSRVDFPAFTIPAP